VVSRHNLRLVEGFCIETSQNAGTGVKGKRATQLGLGSSLDTRSHGSKVCTTISIFILHKQAQYQRSAKTRVGTEFYTWVLHTREFDSLAELNGKLTRLYGIVNGIVGMKRERTYGFYRMKLV
jgi:hypothetical protein